MPKICANQPKILEIMIKKSIAVFAALLLMSSSLNADVEVFEEESYACFDASANLADAVGAAYGWSPGEIHNYFLQLYDFCVAGGGNQ